MSPRPQQSLEGKEQHGWERKCAPCQLGPGWVLGLSTAMGNSTSPSCNPVWLGGPIPWLAYENIIPFPLLSHLCRHRHARSHAEMWPLLGDQLCFQGSMQCGIPCGGPRGARLGACPIPGSMPGSGRERNTTCPGDRAGGGSLGGALLPDHQRPTCCDFLQQGNFGSLMAGQCWHRLGRRGA